MNKHFKLERTVGVCAILAQACGTDNYNGSVIYYFVPVLMLTRDGKTTPDPQKVADFQIIGQHRRNLDDYLIGYLRGYQVADSERPAPRQENWRFHPIRAENVEIGSNLKLVG